MLSLASRLAGTGRGHLGSRDTKTSSPSPAPCTGKRTFHMASAPTGQAIKCQHGVDSAGAWCGLALVPPIRSSSQVQDPTLPTHSVVTPVPCTGSTREAQLLCGRHGSWTQRLPLPHGPAHATASSREEQAGASAWQPDTALPPHLLTRIQSLEGSRLRRPVIQTNQVPRAS